MYVCGINGNKKNTSALRKTKTTTEGAVLLKINVVE